MARGGLIPVWRKAFAPLRRWVNSCALYVAAEVQRNYREFRLERGTLTYDDQVALANELLQHPEAARRIREKNYRMILDEAQDTDPQQFSVLLRLRGRLLLPADGWRTRQKIRLGPAISAWSGIFSSQFTAGAPI